MKHRLFTILSALSLLLCIASAGMWMRSSHHGDSVALNMPYHVATVVSASGGVYFEWLLLTFEQQEWRAEFGLEEPAPQPGWRLRTELGARVEFDEPDDYAYRREHLGFWWSDHDFAWNSESPPFRGGWQVGIPYWAISLLTAILPAVRLNQFRRQRLCQRQGLCPTCGYDLRASPDRCPECGTPIPAALVREPIA